MIKLIDDKFRFSWLEPILFALVLVVIIAWVSSCDLRPARASEVDLAIIAKIESNNTPYAYNPRTQATGLFQITPVCLKEWNDFHYGNEWGMDALFDKFVNRMIADWYINIRIPQMLKFYHKPITLENILWAYNAGIGNVVKNRKPQETKNYIKKYLKLAKTK